MLVDTYDPLEGVRNAIAAAEATGVALKGIRLDSGDLLSLLCAARPLLDDAGHPARRSWSAATSRSAGARGSDDCRHALVRAAWDRADRGGLREDEVLLPDGAGLLPAGDATGP
jgi:hypothetical protein